MFCVYNIAKRIAHSLVVRGDPGSTPAGSKLFSNKNWHSNFSYLVSVTLFRWGDVPGERRVQRRLRKHFSENASGETLREGKEREESKERREVVGERRERGVGEREKDDKRLQQSREILSMDTGPFRSNIHGIQPFQLNKSLKVTRLKLTNCSKLILKYRCT